MIPSFYGGAPFVLSKDDGPDADSVLAYEAYQYGSEKPLFGPSFQDTTLPDNITRYVAYGGAVNAPSENKAWYFSGMTSRSRGPIYFNTYPNGSDKAQVISNSLISLDMSVQYEEEWTNTTLPANVSGRANPELVWVPVGKQGILVVLGGVVYPEWAGDNNSTNPEKSVSHCDHHRGLKRYSVP